MASPSHSYVYTERHFLYCPHDFAPAPLLLRILEEVIKSLESCASSLEIEYIFYKNNIHAAYLTRDVPKDSSVDTVDSSIVSQALLGQIHSGF